MFPRRLSHLFLPAALFLTGCGILGPSDLDELAENRRRWQAVRPAEYTYVLQRSCFCGRTGRFQIDVRGDTIAGVTHRDTGEALPATEWPGFEAVDGVFDLLEDALRDADEVRVVYEATMGYPREIDIDHFREAVDDELSLRLDAVTPLS